jgi:hypothetical protein
MRTSFFDIPDIPVYRVDAEGGVRRLGVLGAMRPDGFEMRQEDGESQRYDDLPWWLADMRPQGYLGRAYARRYAAEMGLPERLADWSSAHVLRALLAHGHDVVGNLLLGETSCERFLSAPSAEAIDAAQKPETYAHLAREATRGEAPGSSAGGEQPKFTACAMTPRGPRHVLVKFSEPSANPVTDRWRDLLLAEHLALETLRVAGISAAETRIVDNDDIGQRFLEVERFDRVGARGRRGLFSLTALEAEFSGEGLSAWPSVTPRLAAEGVIRREALAGVGLLWAFGALIGNTDMHGGNLSFLDEHGRPFDLAPAYDMLPMAFQPRGGGGLPDEIPAPRIHPAVSNPVWRRALELAGKFLARLRGPEGEGFTSGFQPCIAAAERHVEAASALIGS